MCFFPGSRATATPNDSRSFCKRWTRPSRPGTKLPLESNQTRSALVQKPLGPTHGVPEPAGKHADSALPGRRRRRNLGGWSVGWGLSQNVWLFHVEWLFYLFFSTVFVRIVLSQWGHLWVRFGTLRTSLEPYSANLFLWKSIVSSRFIVVCPHPLRVSIEHGLNFFFNTWPVWPMTQVFPGVPGSTWLRRPHISEIDKHPGFFIYQCNFSVLYNILFSPNSCSNLPNTTMQALSLAAKC